MLEQRLDCLADGTEPTRSLHAVRPRDLADRLQRLSEPEAAFVRASGFSAATQELLLLPGPLGVSGAILGLGDDRSPYAFGGLAFRLPENSAWRFEPGDFNDADATLGFCLGAYRFTKFKPGKRAPARLAVADTTGQTLAAAKATWMVRDLINTPADHLGPAELAEFTAELGRRYSAVASVTAGPALEESYPAVAAVGRGSARTPAVVCLRWAGSEAHATAPLVSLCGKGVCFDTGGYDIKSSSGMLRMKKDMGGAASVLGLARLIMEADLPLRLMVRVVCVENSISGIAMRPGDVIRTRAGLTIEVGNTDAEGRLALCDLLAEAARESPAILIDCATLTGAARVALGPDLPALFCNDDGWAATLVQAGNACHDPLWRLPLWSGYEDWLSSPVADVNNVSPKPFAGAVVAGLFLQRFITPLVPWAHIDLYAWNDQAQPGRPEGGEAQAMRALFNGIRARLVGPEPDRNIRVTSS